LDRPVGFRTGLESRRKPARTWRVGAFALAVVTAECPTKAAAHRVDRRCRHTTTVAITAQGA
ncbi:hypothetical protein, partial [Lacticaseibacillus pantheris]|uniref:hypothetical protein n=1 Tax=Lacticaseibacillus pantheris TaxID=171523 RepID=UPI001CDA868A